MSNKLEQMNIRLTGSLKEQINELAKRNEMKTSDFVRQTLEDAIESKTLDNQNNLSQSTFFNREKIALQAAAFIAHTDTGILMADCLKIALEAAKEFNLTELADPNKLTREDREKKTIEINKEVAKRLQVSSKANFLIHLILATYIGINYNEEIFTMSPLSMLVMGEMKDFLNN